MNIDKNTPAFPSDNFGQKAQPGMPLAAYAAIHLRVPNSGIDWLDAMIEMARKDQFAGMALQAILSSPHFDPSYTEFGKSCYGAAESMLAASKPAVEEPSEPEWIEWNKDHCPVKEGVRGDYKLQSGHVGIDAPLSALWWSRGLEGATVIAYRIGGGK